MALGCTVRELLARCTGAELTEWLAYYSLEPFGEERADLRAGIVASTIARANGSKSAKPSDFMPKFEEQDPEDMKRVLERVTHVCERRQAGDTPGRHH